MLDLSDLFSRPQQASKFHQRLFITPQKIFFPGQNDLKSFINNKPQSLFIKPQSLFNTVQFFSKQKHSSNYEKIQSNNKNRLYRSNGRLY